MATNQANYSDLPETQRQVVEHRLKGSNLYREFCHSELEIYKNCMEAKFAEKSKIIPLNPENKHINFESHKITPKLSTKQLEHKLASAEKALEFSFKIY